MFRNDKQKENNKQLSFTIQEKSEISQLVSINLIFKNQQIDKERLSKLIVLVGDESSQKYVENIDKLIQEIINYEQNKKSELHETVCQIFIDSISYLNGKASIYATVVSLLQIQESTRQLSEELLARGYISLQNFINEQKDNEIRNIFLFFSESTLNGHFNPNSLKDLIISILKHTVQQQQQFYLQFLAQIIPQINDCLQKFNIDIQEINQLFKKSIENQNKLLLSATSPFRSQQQNSDYTYQLYKKYTEQTKIQSLFVKAQELYQDQLKKVEQQKYQVFQLTFPIKQSKFKSNFLLNFTSNQNLSLEQMLHHGNIVDILKEFQQFIFEQFLGLLRYIHQENQIRILLIVLTYNMRYQLIQQLIVLFSCLVLLPGLYSSAPCLFNITSILIKIYNKILEQIEDFEYEIVGRLADILAHQLNNNIKWEWESHQFDKNQFTLQTYFYKQVFNQLQSFIGREKLEENIPSNFHPLFSSQEKYNSRFLNHESYKNIMDKLNQKMPADELIDVIQHNQNYEIFLDALFVKMSPSFTHLKILFERYQTIFKQFNDPAKLSQTIFNFWSKSKPFLIKYVEKFYDQSFINLSDILNTIFTQLQCINDQYEALHLIELLQIITSKYQENQSSLFLDTTRQFVALVNNKQFYLYENKLKQLIRQNINLIDWNQIRPQILNLTNQQLQDNILSLQKIF